MKCDLLVSKFAFTLLCKCNLYRYMLGKHKTTAAAAAAAGEEARRLRGELAAKREELAAATEAAGLYSY
jgi:hypothetical protein